MTIEICYSGVGDAVNDFCLDKEIEIVKDFIRNWPEGYTLYYSTENIFTRIRLEVVSGRISENDIIFSFNDTLFPVNRFGAVLNWPTGFCDVNIRMSETILRKALAKRKAEK